VKVVPDVAARARQSGDELALYRIDGEDHDDGDAAGGILCRHHSGRGRRNNHIHLSLDQLYGEGRQALGLPLGPAVFDGQVLTLDPAKLSQRLHERLEYMLDGLPGGRA